MIATCVFIKVELDVIATIEVFDVVISPSGDIVLLEWDIDRLPGCSSHGARNAEAQQTC